MLNNSITVKCINIIRTLSERTIAQKRLIFVFQADPSNNEYTKFNVAIIAAKIMKYVNLFRNSGINFRSAANL